MVLYLFRHGIAGPAPPGQGDAARTLTPEGIDQLKRQARALERAGFRMDRLLTSPLVRARQTADLLAPALGVPSETDTLLQPGFTLDDAAELLARHAQAWRLMFVGHQPDPGRLVRFLTGSNAKMLTGTMAVIDVQAVRPSGGLLLGLYDPEVMARLAPV